MLSFFYLHSLGLKFFQFFEVFSSLTKALKDETDEVGLVRIKADLLRCSALIPSSSTATVYLCVMPPSLLLTLTRATAANRLPGPARPGGGKVADCGGVWGCRGQLLPLVPGKLL